jgi:hypothetical protein
MPTRFADSREWQSEYDYQHDGVPRSSRHVLRRRRLWLRRWVSSTQRPQSRLTLWLRSDGPLLTGRWVETTSLSGPFEGRVFRGAVQFRRIDDETYEGVWVGAGRSGEINTGRWRLTRSTAAS